MRRLFYVAVGVTAGVIVTRRVTRTAQKFTPGGLAAQAGGLGGQITGWWSIVQASAAAREAELRAALGIDDDDRGHHAA